MLPDGILAKHGYTTRWGFFQGICQGSGEKPFEKSCDLVEKFIERARARYAELDAFRMSLLEPPAAGTRKAWVHVYRTGNARTRSGYAWMELELEFIQKTSADGSVQWLELWHEDQDRPGRKEQIRMYGNVTRSLDPLAYIAELNSKRSAALRADLEQVERYINWQTLRVKSWTERELKPRPADKPPGPPRPNRWGLSRGRRV